MGYDITKTAVSETGTCELNGPDDEPLYDGKTRLAIEVFGPGSKQFAKAQTRRSNKAMERIRKKGKPDISADDSAEESAIYLATITKSINFDYPPAAGRDDFQKFKALYKDETLGFIRDQVAEFVGEWGNFTGKSSGN